MTWARIAAELFWSDASAAAPATTASGNWYFSKFPVAVVGPDVDDRASAGRTVGKAIQSRMLTVSRVRDLPRTIAGGG